MYYIKNKKIGKVKSITQIKIGNPNTIYIDCGNNKKRVKTNQVIDTVHRSIPKETFKNTILYLIENDALVIKGEQLFFYAQNVPSSMRTVRNTTTRIIKIIESSCKRM